MSLYGYFVLNEETRLKKDADYITKNSLLIPDHQREESLTSLCDFLFAKFLGCCSIIMQIMQNLYLWKNLSVTFQSDSGSKFKSESFFYLKSYQSHLIFFSRTILNPGLCSTTGPVIYCVTKAENRENLKHKNYTNHVSNNCLEPTYN